MELPFEVVPYREIKDKWPSAGKIILGTFTDSTVVLYQAYNSTISAYAAKNGTFKACPEFSTSRMTWLKPNFLWMMYRSGWGTKVNQQNVLAISIRREGFETILKCAATHGDGDVRLQWDPDHDPYGQKLERRAIQLGIRNGILDQFMEDWIVRIDDITPFVEEQRAVMQSGNLDKILVPKESIIPISRAAHDGVGADEDPHV